MKKVTRQNKKALKAILLAVVVVAGGYYAVHEGWIPGIGQGKKTAENLKVRVEAMEGNKIEQVVIDFISRSYIISMLPAERQLEVKNSLQQSFAEDVDLNLSYEDINTSAADGRGIVELIKPKLEVLSLTDSKNFDVTVPSMTIAQEANGDEHYFYSVKGDIEIYSDVMGKGEKTKVFVLSSESNESEVELEDGKPVLQKFSAKNLKFIEGRGNTTLLSVDEMATENSQSRANGQIEVASKAVYTNVRPGDMIKLFIGNIEPANIKLDYAYKGDDVLGRDDIKGFDGKLDLNNFSFKLGNSGLETHGKLKFKKENEKSLPYGDLYVKITNYRKLIELLVKYYPINPADLANLGKFFMEVGADEGEDVSFDLKFNGTDKYLVNGKSEEEFDIIFNKYFPGMETPAAEKEALPLEKTPTVEKRKL